MESQPNGRPDHRGRSQPKGRETDSLVVEVDPALCASFGRCIDLEPDAFEFDENDQATAKPGAMRLSPRRIRAVIEVCPTGAISARKAEPSSG